MQTYRKPESGISKETVLNISKSDDQKMIRTIEYRISRADLPEQGPGPTVNEYLRKRAYSRHLMTYLRHHEDTLTVNGRSVFTNCHLAEGDVVRITFTDEVRSVGIIPVPLPLDICYEDEDILVVNKPPFLPIQPSLGHPERTLGNAVAAYYEGQGIPFVYRCVNRLDRNTSGLVIIAKNMASSAILYEEMKERRIHRTYFTVVHGRPDIPGGTIDLPIARKTPSLMERCVDPENGQRAVTHFTELSWQESNNTTALAVCLETGRTHQIRVHMSYTGHPVVGDSLYGMPYGDLIDRQALHSWKLEFMHPISRKDLYFEAPLPEDIRSLLS